MEKRFEELTDEEIVRLAKEGDVSAVECLLDRYKNLVRARTRYYFLSGADHEDIVQEGMIGLIKAIRDFKDDRQAAFHSFADVCISRQILSAVKASTRQKHIPLNSYVSLNTPVYDSEGERTLMDVISVQFASNPEDLIIGQEDRASIEADIREVLTELEINVLNAYLEGKSYEQIVKETGTHYKCVDNALQRIKRKTERILKERKDASSDEKEQEEDTDGTVRPRKKKMHRKPKKRNHKPYKADVTHPADPHAEEKTGGDLQTATEKNL